MILRKFVVGDMGNNNYLLIDNGEAVLIDATGVIPELDSVLKENNAELKHIFLTHGHFDHIGGIKALQERYNLKVYLHEGDKELVEGVNEFLDMVGLPHIDKPRIDVYLKGDEKLKVGDMEFEVIKLAGHTQGGVGYKLNNMLFSGDTIFLNSIGRTDLPGGDYETLVKNIKEKIFTLDDNTIIYSGHGGDTSVGYEKKYNIIANDSILRKIKCK